MIIGALFIIIQFGYYPWAPEFWVPQKSKVLNFMGTQPKNTHGIQTQTQPNPFQNFDSGSGITLWYPNFG